MTTPVIIVEVVLAGNTNIMMVCVTTTTVGLSSASLAKARTFASASSSSCCFSFLILINLAARFNRSLLNAQLYLVSNLLKYLVEHHASLVRLASFRYLILRPPTLISHLHIFSNHPYLVYPM